MVSHKVWLKGKSSFYQPFSKGKGDSLPLRLATATTCAPALGMRNCFSSKAYGRNIRGIEILQNAGRTAKNQWRSTTTTACRSCASTVGRASRRTTSGNHTWKFTKTSRYRAVLSAELGALLGLNCFVLLFCRCNRTKWLEVQQTFLLNLQTLLFFELDKR